MSATQAIVWAAVMSYVAVTLACASFIVSRELAREPGDRVPLWIVVGIAFLWLPLMVFHWVTDPDDR